VLGCYILCSESLVEFDRLTVAVKGMKNNLKVKSVQLGRFEFKDIDNKSKAEVVGLGKFEFE
jgi:hypothetical protein